MILRQNVLALIDQLPAHLTTNLRLNNDDCFSNLLTNGIILNVDPLTTNLEPIVSHFNKQLYNHVIRYMHNTTRFTIVS